MDIIYQQQHDSADQPVFYGEVMTGVSIAFFKFEVWHKVRVNLNPLGFQTPYSKL